MGNAASSCVLAQIKIIRLAWSNAGGGVGFNVRFFIAESINGNNSSPILKEKKFVRFELRRRCAFCSDN